MSNQEPPSWRELMEKIWERTDRAISLLNSVDENIPEQTIKLVDAAVDDLIHVRAALAIATDRPTEWNRPQRPLHHCADCGLLGRQPARG